MLQMFVSGLKLTVPPPGFGFLRSVAVFPPAPEPGLQPGYTNLYPRTITRPNNQLPAYLTIQFVEQLKKQINFVWKAKFFTAYCDV